MSLSIVRFCFFAAEEFLLSHKISRYHTGLLWSGDLEAVSTINYDANVIAEGRLFSVYSSSMIQRRIVG